MIQLRPVTQQDDRFIIRLYRSTREKELKLTNWPEVQKDLFVTMQSTAQLAEYRQRYPDADWQVIVFEKNDAGRLYTWEGPDEIRLIDITLLPAFRGKGIGTFILGELIRRSAMTHKKISLHVDPSNPALQLYLRLGFTRQGINGRHYYLERLPG